MLCLSQFQALPSPRQPPGKFWGQGQFQPPGQIFWSNALPLVNFQRSNPKGPGRFFIFLLSVNNLSLRFRRRCFLPAMEKKLIPKKTHMYTKANRLFIKYCTNARGGGGWVMLGIDRDVTIASQYVADVCCSKKS